MLNQENEKSMCYLNQQNTTMLLNDLARKLTKCEHLIEDLNDLINIVLEQKPTQDDIANILIGLTVSYKYKHKELDMIIENLSRSLLKQNSQL